MINLIRQKIAAAIQEEEQSGMLAQHLQTTLTAGGEPLDEAALGQAVELARQYIEQVPALLERTIMSATAKQDLESIQPLLQAAAGYFINPIDVIPDHIGLYGLLDDAYLCNKLLAEMSATYLQLTGQPLLAVDLGPPNRIAANFIGRQVAAQLDQTVSAAIQQRVYEVQMRNLAANNFGGAAASGGGSWGHTFEDQTAEFFARNGVSYNVETQYVDQDGVVLY